MPYSSLTSAAGRAIPRTTSMPAGCLWSVSTSRRRWWPHTGDQQLHLDEWFDRAVSLDAHLFDPAEIAGEMEAAGLVVEARLDRRPYPDIEVPTERSYLLTRRTPVPG